MNPYNKCTFNKMVNGARCMILYHVNSLRISYQDQSVINDIVILIYNTFKTKNQSLSVMRGHIHNYLIIRIYCNRNDCVTFTMYNYLEEIFKEVDVCGDMNGTAITPASDNLFTIEKLLLPLSNKQSNFFNGVIARFLFTAKQPRPDIQVAVLYSCTRVKCPIKSDYQK